MRVIQDAHGVTYVAAGVLTAQEKAELAARPVPEPPARVTARTKLQAQLAAAEPDLATRLWMEKVRITAELKRRGWID